MTFALRGLAAAAVIMMASGLGLGGCGEDPALRPMSVDVQGLSALAERLVVVFVTGDDAPLCTQVSLDNVTTYIGEVELVWERASNADRFLEAGNFETDQLTVLAYTEDAGGAVIQVGCRQVDYLDIESPEVEVTLSVVML